MYSLSFPYKKRRHNYVIEELIRGNLQLSQASTTSMKPPPKFWRVRSPPIEYRQ